MRRTFLVMAAAAAVALGSIRCLGADLAQVATRSAWRFEGGGAAPGYTRRVATKRGRSAAEQKRASLKRRNRLRHKARCRGKRA